MVSESARRVAFRYAALGMARDIVSEPSQIRTAGSASVRREFTAEVLAAFAEGIEKPQVRFASNLSRRLKQLWEAFQTSPSKWESFKKMLGVKAQGWLGVARELPGKIRSMLADGKKWLSGVGRTLTQKIPLLKLYFDVGVKLPSVGDWMNRALDRMPEPIQRGVRAITSRVKSLAQWVDDLQNKHRVLRPAGALISAAVFAVIWLNVTELSWDVPEIIRGFLGGYSFLELLHSLPESGVGLLISFMFPGLPGGLIWNAILPITVALRLAWMIQREYVEWSPGKELVIHWDRIGVSPPDGGISDRMII